MLLKWFDFSRTGRNIFIESLRNAMVTDSHVLLGDSFNKTYELRYRKFSTDSFPFIFLLPSVSPYIVVVI